MELGIYTFGELTPDARTGRTISPEERLRNLVEEIELADQVGLDVFGIGGLGLAYTELVNPQGLKAGSARSLEMVETEPDDDAVRFPPAHQHR
jgi:predicted amino acid dehydrogenase